MEGKGVGGVVAIAVALDGPWWITVEGQGLVDFLEFDCLADWAGGEEAGASGEGEDGGALVLEWLVGIPCDVLVSVCGFPVYVKLQ
jgi:hypothetical protein